MKIIILFIFFLILPVDLSARVLPRQRSLLWISFAPRSFCSSRLNSSQEPEENKVAPLRLIALRRSSQWKNHQKLRENIWTQGTMRSESQCTRKYSKSVPQKSVKRSLYTWAFLSPDGYTSRHVARIQLYTCHHLELPQPERHFYSFRHSTKLSTQGVTWCMAFLGATP